MYAVIETGGKQYRVEVGTELEVELLDGEPGDSLTLDRVLLVGDGDETSIGRPVVANAAVEAEVVRRDRGDKVVVFKYRPKARRRVKKGHRQDHTVLRITDVKLNGRSAAEAARKAERDAVTERQRLEEAAARQAAADAELAAKLAGERAADTSKSAAKTGRATGKRGGTRAATSTTDDAKAAGDAGTSGGGKTVAARPADARTPDAAEPATGATSDGDDAAAADEAAPKGAAPRRRTKKDE